MSKYAELKPLKMSKRLKERIFYTFDIETKDGLRGTDMFCYSLSYMVQGRNFKGILSKNLDELFDFFEETFKPKRKNQKIIYSHNLTFDIRFILDYCMCKGIECNCIFSGSSVIFARIDEFNVLFIDSFQFLKESQESAEIRYEVPEKFTKIDCSNLFEKDFSKWNESDKERVLAHNKNDTIALHIIMQNFRKFMFEISNVDIFHIFTPASLSMKALRKNLEETIVNPFLITRFNPETRRYGYEIVKEKEEFARMSYYGGRTECFNHNLLENCDYVDVVSLYSDAMKNNDYPKGLCYWSTEHSEISNAIKNGILCIVECEVNAPYLHIPVLPHKTDKLLFPIGKFRGVYCSPEIEYALECGYQIDFLRALIYPSKSRPFKKFVDIFFKIKSQSKGGRRSGSKLLLNSSYGKFGQKFERNNTKSKFFKDEYQALEFYNSIIDKDENAILRKIIYDTYEVRYKEESVHAKPFMNVAIASFVTCYARLKEVKMIHKQEKLNNNVWYCDTDSVVCQNTPVNLSKKLGGWDIENHFEFFKCYAPKGYIFKQKGKPINFKLKGLNRKTKEKLLQECNSIKEIEEKIINKEITNDERYLTIKESLRRNSCVLSSAIKSKTFKMLDTKRFVKSDGTTEPFYIQNDKIFNYNIKEERKMMENKEIVSYNIELLNVLN